LFVLILDTPGGLVDATIDITKTLMNASLPVAVLVAPSGAIAALKKYNDKRAGMLYNVHNKVIFILAAQSFSGKEVVCFKEKA